MYNDSAMEYLLNQNSEWVKLQDKITQAWAEVEKYQKAIDQANAAAPLAKDTAEYQQKQQRVAELTGKLDVYKAKLNEAENAEKGENAQLKSSSNGLANVKAKLTQAISALKLLANGARRAGNAIKTAFSKTVGKAISNIRDHFKKANNSTNILEKSLRRIKNTLIRMFFFRLVHSPIDAIKDGLGEIAKISPEVNKNLSALKTESTYLKNSFAALAAPLVTLLTPAFTTFFGVLANVTNKAGQLVAVLTGQSYTKAIKIQQDYASSLDESTKSANKNTKALEKNQKALAGFDELNVLDLGDTDSDESTTSTPMFEYIGNSAEGLSKSLLDALRNGDFEAVGEMFAEKINSALKKIKWTKIKATVKSWASNIVGFLNGFIAKTDWNLVGTTIAEGLGTALLFANTLVNKFDFSQLGAAFGNIINGILSPRNAALFADTASKFIVGIFAALATAVKTVDWGKVGATIISLITHFRFADIANGAANLLNGFASALHKIDFKQIGEAFRTGLSKINWRNIWNGVTRLTTNALQGIADFFGLKGVSTSKLKTALQDIYEPISELYETLKKSVSELIVPIVNKFLPAAVKSCGSIAKGISPIVRSLTPIFKKAIEVVSSITENLAPAVETLGDTIGKVINLVSPIIQPILNLIDKVVQFLAPAMEGVLDFVGKTADFLSPISSFIGGIIDGISGLFGMLSGKSEPTISATLQEELDHLSNISDDLVNVQNNINNAINSVDENLAATTSDLQYIDDLKERMVELLNKSTLTPEDMQQLNTIADLISEKCPEFMETWDTMIKKDEDGKIALVGNRDATIQSIENTIDALKRQYATEALQEQYKELYKERFKSNQDIAESVDSLKGSYDEINKTIVDYEALATIAQKREEEWNEARANGSRDEEVYYERYKKTSDEVEALKDDYDAAKDKLAELETETVKAYGEQGKMDAKLQALNDTISITNGDFENNEAGLQKLRNAYSLGFISLDEIKEQFNVSGKELFEGTQSMAENSIAGYNKGIENGKADLNNIGFFISDTVLEAAREGFDEHSPSKEFEEIGEYGVQGLELGIEKRTPILLKLIRSLANSVTSAMQNGLANLGAVFNSLPGMAKTGLNNTLSVFEDFLSSLTSGFNSVYLQLNSLSKAAAESGGKSTYTVYSQLSTARIPRLATGTYIPANYGEFLAVLGDNKREAEVVSPVSAMEQAMMNALYKSGMFGGSDDKEINLFIDGDKFFSWIVGKSNQYRKSHGNSPFQGVDI